MTACDVKIMIMFKNGYTEPFKSKFFIDDQIRLIYRHISNSCKNILVTPYSYTFSRVSFFCFYF